MTVRVRQRKKDPGIWWVFINHQGKRKAKKIGTDEKLARKVAKQIEAKLTLGLFDLKKKQPQSPLFKEVAEKYLAFIQMSRSESTYERYEGILRKHILPVFKNKPVDTISRGDIRDFLVMKKRKYDVKLMLTVLSGVFNFAIEDEILKSNPTAGIGKTLGLKKNKTKDVDPLNEADLSLLFEATKKHTLEYYPFFFMAARTGMRLGELLAVRWRDVDFNHTVRFEDGTVEHRPFIWVRRSYRRRKFGPPKSGKSRKVDMSNQLKEVLQNYLTREKRKALEKGLNEIPELLFHNNGKVIEQNDIRKIFKRILRKARVREVNLHSLRHSFASILLSKGESPVYVKEQLGHHSIQITVDIYGKWIQTKREVGVNRLDTQPSATYPQPKNSRETQPIEITSTYTDMVPKAGIEPAQAFTH